MISYRLFLLLLTILPGMGLIAQSYTWEIDRQIERTREAKKQDSLAIVDKRFLYPSQFYLKTEFPIQTAIGYQFMTPVGLAFHGSVGLYPRAFTKVVLNLVPDDRPNAQLTDFLEDRLRNGSVIELGTGYYSLKSGFFGLLGLQFQQYSFSATLDELVETLDVGEQLSSNGTDFTEMLETSPTLSTFYYDETLYPTFRPLNLAVSGGKLFRFSAVPQFSVKLAIAYSFNLRTKFSVESSSPVGRLITSNVINPLLAENAQASNTVGLPTVSLTVCYQFGELIR